MEFFFKYGCLGVLCRGLFILSLIFVSLWLLWKLLSFLWPVVLCLLLVWGIYKLAKRQAKRKG